MYIVLAFAGLLLAQAAAPTPTAVAPPQVTAPAEPAPVVKPEKANKQKMVCHSETATGSIMSKRVCRTPEQIEADRLQAKRDTDSLSDHLAACRGTGC
jgi:hypothetical protein